LAAMALPQRDAQHHTYADYLTWPEDLRYELIEGVAYLMTPAPSRPRQEIAGEIYRQAANALQGKPCRAYVAPFDVRLPKAAEADEEIDTVVQPDVLVVCDRRKLDERGLRGAPDWVVEVLSPSTAGHDQTLKLAAYERAGVPEVWLIHPTDRLLTIYRFEAAGYGRPVILELKGQTSVASVPDLSIDWNRLLAQLDG
jgi:Uma2 family endonuclease